MLLFCTNCRSFRHCRECKRMPLAERAIHFAHSEIEAFLAQRNISKKNQQRLRELLESTDRTLAIRAQAVLDAAQISSHRKHRTRKIRLQAPELWNRLLELGLYPGHHEEAEFDQWLDDWQLGGEKAEIDRQTHPPLSELEIWFERYERVG